MNRLRLIVGIVVLVAGGGVVPEVAATDAYGGGSVHGYSAESPLETGSIVTLTSKDSNRVKVAQQTNAANMFGVVVDRNQLPLTVSQEGLSNETYVAVSGTYNVLVSTQAGPIAAGDYVTLSSIEGVAMKASTEDKTVLGRAGAGFDGKDITLGTSTLKDVNGSVTQTVKLGTVPVTIAIMRNPTIKTTKANVPPALERIGQAIAEKEVSPIRIYLSLAITAVCLIAAIVVLYAGIRNGVISIGRNPMSKKSIFRAILEVILTSVLIVIVGLFAVYLLLRL